jgi:hypothetical protein
MIGWATKQLKRNEIKAEKVSETRPLVIYSIVEHYEIPLVSFVIFLNSITMCIFRFNYEFNSSTNGHIRIQRFSSGSERK